ncbi:flagellar brake protein [Ectothiorhodospiraceae bacterium WFHF3C12]|nr:flagellar brake protein [Ectothiorhodospiraceae bacterium WFHF3C12]
MAMNDSNEPQRIRKAAQQGRLLNQLKDQHCPLSVRIPALTRNQYTSAIVSVDTRRSRLYLDELNPAGGHKHMQVGSEVRIETRAHGVETRFKTRVESIGEEDGISYYVVPFPETITYHQRRAFHRVPVRMTLQSRATLRSESAELTVRLTDISVGGFGGTASGDAPLTSGETYRCELELHGADPLEADVEIRHVHRDRVRRNLRFGALFLNLDRRQRGRVERLVMELERELIRST